MLARAMQRSISIVGAGRVGRALAAALRRAGWKIGAVLTRSPATARAAVRAIGAGKPSSRFSPEILASRLVLIATPDREIPRAATSLARFGLPAAASPKAGLRAGAGRRAWQGKIVLHTSGALDRRALAPLADLGAFTGSLHPMQTFTRDRAPSLAGAVFGIEGDARALRMARAIVRDLGGIPVRIRANRKPAYHAASSLAAGHALALIEAAAQILISFGWPRRRALRTLLSLTRQMLDNLERSGPRAAWTGPIARGDYETVAKHLRALRQYPREFADAYLALARLAARLLVPDPARVLRALPRL